MVRSSPCWSLNTLGIVFKAIVQSNSDLAKSLNTLEAIVKKTDSNDRILLASVVTDNL